MSDIRFLAADLAPGDARAAGLVLSNLSLVGIDSVDHVLFPEVYQRLWQEFGDANEMETVDVIKRRLSWHPARQIGHRWLRYEMAAIRHQESLIAMRDHVAIVSTNGQGPRAVVHLSHLLVEPEWRRTGLAGWLRAVPLQTACSCFRVAGVDPESPMTLVAEMEHPTSDLDARMIRLRAYEKAGFRKIASDRVDYHQPDFRPPEKIDATGHAMPLPFALIVRRVGRESESEIPARELVEIVDSLYHMYATGCRDQDMAPLWSQLEALRSMKTPISLVPPTAR